MNMKGVLELMLYSYAIMVSGLLIPVLALLIFKKPNTTAALSAMIVGGGSTIILSFFEKSLPFGLAANIFGITAAAIIYIAIHFNNQNKVLKHEI
jgi:SSS family solute:Na+ symporter